MYTIANRSGAFTSGGFDSLADRLTGQTATIRNYRLFYVDNGVGLDGLSDFFYIYIPQQIGFVTNTGRLRIAGATPTGDGDWIGTAPVGGPSNDDTRGAAHGANNLAGYVLQRISEDVAAVAPVTGRAFMYTALGEDREDVTFYRELDRLRTDLRLAAASPGNMWFEGTAAQITFGRRGADRAVGAWGPDTPAAVRPIRSAVTVFGDEADNTPYFARETRAAGTEPGFNRFGVILGTEAVGAGMIVGVNAVTRYNVFDIANNRTVQMFLNGPDLGGDLSGAYIAFRENLDNNLIHDARVLARPVVGQSHALSLYPRSVDVLGAGTGMYGVMHAGTTYAADITSTALEGMVTLATNTLTLPAVLNNIGSGTTQATASINTSTKYVLVSDVDVNGRQVARIFNSMLELSADVGPATNDAMAVAFVATGSIASRGVAQIVFVSSAIEPDEILAEPIRLGTIVSTTNSWDEVPGVVGRMWTGTAFVHGEGNVPVAVNSADVALLTRGNLVNVGNTVGLSTTIRAITPTDMANPTNAPGLLSTTMLNEVGTGANQTEILAPKVRAALAMGGALASGATAGNEPQMTAGRVVGYTPGGYIRLTGAPTWAGNTGADRVIDLRGASVYNIIEVKPNQGTVAAGDAVVAAAEVVANATNPARWFARTAGMDYLINGVTVERQTARGLSYADWLEKFAPYRTVNTDRGGAVWAVVTIDAPVPGAGATVNALAVTLIIYNP